MLKGGRKVFLSFTLLMIVCHIKMYVQAISSSNVLMFGAKGDGITDDSSAFLRAWEAVCGASTASMLIIPPKRTFLLKPLTFQGPCKSTNIIVEILGTIIAPNSIAAFQGFPLGKWLRFDHVDWLTVTGGGIGKINGQGANWWKLCPQPGQICQQRPTAMLFYHCNNLKLEYLKLFDSPSNFVALAACDSVTVSHLHIQAPEHSPNTDGINLIGATRVDIHDSQIGVGDDCISINNHAHHVTITGVLCGPGHGISIGSLGHDTVEHVNVTNCNITGTLGGVKIKTWQGGEGFARDISFESISVTNVLNPIIIDQYYCPNRTCALNETSAIKISDITYKNIFGSSATEDAVTFNCSTKFGCENIQLDQINLRSIFPGKFVKSQIINARGKVGNNVIPEVRLYP